MIHLNTPLFASLFFTCLLTLTTGCSPEKAPAKEYVLTAGELETVERIGSEASQALKKSLGTQLKAALQSGGPENALRVCQQVAQPLTIQTSENLAKATVTRTALRFRNQANAPTEQDREILSEWENLLEKGAELTQSKIISTGPDQAIYYKPILTESVCLKCHGDPSGFSPALSKRLAESYPDDNAIHFATGDLRGAFRVVIELD